MKASKVLLVSFCLLSIAPLTSGNAFSHHPFSIFSSQQNAPSRSSQIRGIQVFGISSGIAYTTDALYITLDDGENWDRARVPLDFGHELVFARFTNESVGNVLVADVAGDQLRRLDTSDGGRSWLSTAIHLERNGQPEDLTLLDLGSARLWTPDGGETISIRLATSSNFRETRFYGKRSGHALWSYEGSMDVDLEYQERFERFGAGPDESAKSSVIASEVSDGHSGHKVHSSWFLTQIGSCSGFKSGCVQTTRLYKRTAASSNGKLTNSLEEITPPELSMLNEAEKAEAALHAHLNRMFAAPPGGSIRTSLNRGFDKCQAGSVAQMQIWWDQSHHFDTNIYFSGRNRACPSQPFTNNPAWIDAVSAQGWGLIPTVVGYQSPCTSSTTTVKLSYDVVTAEQQGRGEADIAAADAQSIGLTIGSVLYYDMERYDPPNPDTLGCRAATVAFLKGWTERIRQLGYVSGVYGSPKNAIEDWQFMPQASRMDAVWMARWDNVPSVWTYVTFPTFPNNVWENHQRIKQWQAPHNETWGGVTFNIDGNISDGPVAGIPVSRNKFADFDGDGITDISVFRPGTGQWFVAGSLGPSFDIYQYGTAEDMLVPGDYDGDGRTDLVVFRPSNSTWYLRTKGAFGVRTYGQADDVPAQADYDGDGRTDIALFRPSTGVWYIAFSDSRNSFRQVPFGEAGDRPAPADYDGDGKADLAVWRPSNGNWYVQGSAGNYFVAEWGVEGDTPAPADYDGDGKTDLAVFRPSNGTWYIIRSAEGMLIQQFGVDGDQPAPGDYDGDGRYDVAVFRPSNGTWYTSQSQAGFRVRSFGVSTDSPVPSAYLPR